MVTLHYNEKDGTQMTLSILLQEVVFFVKHIVGI